MKVILENSNNVFIIQVFQKIQVNIQVVELRSGMRKLIISLFVENSLTTNELKVVNENFRDKRKSEDSVNNLNSLDNELNESPKKKFRLKKLSVSKNKLRKLQ